MVVHRREVPPAQSWCPKQRLRSAPWNHIWRSWMLQSTQTDVNVKPSNRSGTLSGMANGVSVLFCIVLWLMGCLKVAPLSVVHDMHRLSQCTPMRPLSFRQRVLYQTNIFSLLALFGIHGPFFILDKLSGVAESPRLADKMKYVLGRSRGEDESFAKLMCDLCFALRISLGKKRRLVAELEALREREGAAKPFE
ncbi:hypothetical protein Tco_0785186 [Tanacetum coccineum]